MTVLDFAGTYVVALGWPGALFGPVVALARSRFYLLFVTVKDRYVRPVLLATSKCVNRLLVSK